MFCSFFKREKVCFKPGLFVKKCTLQYTKITVISEPHSSWDTLQIELAFSHGFSNSTAYTHALNLVSIVFSNAIKVYDYLLLDKLVNELLVD